MGLTEVNDDGGGNGNTMSFSKEVATTMATLATGTRTTDTTARRGRSLEYLVDRLMATRLSEETQTASPTTTQSLARSVHDARRLSQARLYT